MTNYEDDDIDDDVEGNEPPEGGGGAAPSGNRNFILALGIMGAIFILVLIALIWFWLSSGQQRGGQQGNVDIEATNQVIETSNAATAAAATQLAGLALTPSATMTATNTLVAPSPTNTQVLAQATATNTKAPGGAILTVTPNLQTRTATIQALLTQNAAQTQTQAAKVKLTSTALPKTGFAEDVGLPGLFGMALGLALLIVLVRRLRLSPNR